MENTIHFDAKKIRLVAIDIDGTLINSQHECTDYTKKVIHQIKNSGREVLIVTGRGTQTAMKYAQAIDVDKYMINYNGASVWNVCEQKREDDRYLSKDQAQECIQWFRELDLVAFAYDNDEIYYEIDNDIKEVYLKKINIPVHFGKLDERDLSHYQKFFCIGIESQVEKLAQICQSNNNISWFMTHPALHNFSATHSENVRSLEIMAKDTNKGKTLQRIAEKLGYTMDEVIAFGDDRNDLEMLAMSGIGVAMGNARPEVKAVANFETLSNNEDGVAYFLEKYFLNT